MELVLSDLAVGESALISALNIGRNGFRQKLLALGILPGSEIKLTRIAPLGDPVELTIKSGARISLAKALGNMIAVSKCPTLR